MDWFCEAFVPGRSVKSWVWCGAAVAFELVEPPYLVGDGRRCLDEIARSWRGSMDATLEIDWSSDWFAWLGVHGGSVLRDGQRLPLDFRYASAFASDDSTDRDRWSSVALSVREQVNRAAQILWQQLPTSDQPSALFTLDGVLDVNGRI